MRASILLGTVLSTLISTVSATSESYKISDNLGNDTIIRDVVIVGGGSAGTYSALSLRDKGVSVIVVEKNDRLGGHTETYIDPATGTPVNLGVVIWHNHTVVTNYFKRLNISIGPMDDYHAIKDHYDFTTGEAVEVYSPDQTVVGAGIQKYISLLAKYPGLDNGTFLPDPVPAELYEPFSTFINRYNLSAIVPSFYNYNPGVGDMLSNPTVEQLKYWGRNSMALSTLRGFLTTSHHNSSELYTHAEAALCGDIFLSSTVTSSHRDGKNVRLTIQTPAGTKHIHAKKLLIAVLPKPDILSPWASLNDQETALFSHFVNVGNYVCLMTNTGIPPNTSIGNAQASSSTNPYNLPKLPGIYSISPSELDGVQIVYYATPQTNASFPETDQDVQREIVASIKRLQASNPAKFTQTEPQFVVFKSHAPYYTQVSSQDIQNGFYKKLYDLQGRRNTFWTGAAWQSQDSSEIWRFSEEIVVPGIMASLGV